IKNIGTSGSPIYTIAGRLTVSLASNSVLNGNGFAFSASLSLEVNTTKQAVDLDGNGSTDRAAGIYVRVHAEGTLSFATGNTGLFIFRLFDISVGTTGLSIAANGKLQAKVGGTNILQLDAVGALLITNRGIAAKIGLTFGSSPT